MENLIHRVTKWEKPNNNEIIIEANESIEITCDRLDKLLNEEIGKPDEKTNNRKNIDKASEQNNKGSINGDNDPDKQKTSKNDGIDSTGSKYNNKTIEKVLNSKDNNNKQEEIKTMNRNNNKDSRERQDKNLSSKDSSV